MKKPEIPANEAERIQELLSLEILDSERESAFDDAVALASYITGCPISLISLIDINRQWFKAKVGLEATETPRDISFCAHAINDDDLFEVPDAKKDERFHDNPLVTGETNIRFYAGQPIVTSNGFRIGTLCTIDREDRQLNDEQRRHLSAIAKQVSALIELRLVNRRQKLKALTQSQFLANVSHEIRTPLTSILGYASMAREESQDNVKASAFLDTIERNSKHVLSILQNVLDVSKLEAGHAPIAQAAFETKELRDHVIAMFGLTTLEKSVDLNVAVDASVPRVLSGDLTRIQQVLTNIVGNAVKFTDTGHIDVKFTYANGVLKVAVQDTGIGLDESHRASLFQPFIQADPAIGKRYGGTGLGLAISRQLCESMGGELSLHESTTGRGSTFVATFQVAVADSFTKPTQKDYDAIARTLRSIGSMATILVVDDKSENRESFKHYLKTFSMSVDEAAGGTEALSLIGKSNYDVIFLDLEMPNLNGLDVLKKIRSLRVKPKVVAFTAHAIDESQLREAGFDFVLPKPFTSDSVAAALFEVLVYG